MSKSQREDRDDEIRHETEGGRYGSYAYRDEQGRERRYVWAQRVEDDGHRVFATLAEAAAFVNSRDLAV